MTERTVVRKSGDKDLDLAYVQRLAEEFKKSKEALAMVEKRTNDIKKELSDIVDQHGVEDEKGNRWVRIGDLNLKREMRLSVSLDRSAVEEWAKENGYWDDIKETVEVLSEDKLLGLAWSDEQVATTVEGFYIRKEVWAFKA